LLAQVRLLAPLVILTGLACIPGLGLFLLGRNRKRLYGAGLLALGICSWALFVVAGSWLSGSLKAPTCQAQEAYYDSPSRKVRTPIAVRHWRKNAAVKLPRLILFVRLPSVSLTPITFSVSAKSR
jgi:hypothetical protein